MDENNLTLESTPLASAEVVIEYLMKRASNGCPSCGYTKWAIKSPFPGDAGFALGMPGVDVHTGSSVSSSIPFALVVCKRCAFVRIHGLMEISKWLADGKPEHSEDA